MLVEWRIDWWAGIERCRDEWMQVFIHFRNHFSSVGPRLERALLVQRQSLGEAARGPG